MAKHVFDGGSGVDILVGTGGDDVVTGRAGDDTLSGGAGNDSVIGSSGHDTLYGESGNDVIKGEDGNDVVYGGAGYDIVRGHGGDDLLYGDDGDDKLEGYDGNDTLWGGNGLDTLQGGAGADIFHAGRDGITDLIVDYSAAQNDMLADGASWTVSGGDTLVYDEFGAALFRLQNYDAGANGILFVDGPVAGPGNGAGEDPADDPVDDTPTAPPPGGSSDPLPSLDPVSGTSSDTFNLSNWKITLPVDSSGGTGGTAVEVSDLIGYENSKYFYNAAGGAMVFVAPVDGATTKGSKYPRTELREMNGSERAAWTLDEGGTMTATLAINEVPTKFDGTPGRVMVGQIHGKGDELIRLYQEDGKLYFMNDQAGSNNSETKFTFKNAGGSEPSIGLNETFSYLIDARDETLTVKIYADGDVYTSVTTINDVWQSDEFYFKAGVYLGVNEDMGTGQGKVAFYGLDFSHTKGQGLDGLVDVVGDVTDDDSGGSDNGGSDNGGSDSGGSDGSGSETPPTDPGTSAGGNAGADYLEGGAGADTLSGGGGDDTVTGRGGDDVVFGGDGNDSVVGSSGNDTLYGDAGDDVIKGEADNDVAFGGAGRDVVRGHSGNDQLHGDAGDDKLEGGDGNDTLSGGAGLDTLEGGAGADVFRAGNDGVADLVVDYSAAENDQLADGLTWQVSGGHTLVYDAAGTLLFRLQNYDAGASGIHLMSGNGENDAPAAPNDGSGSGDGGSTDAGSSDSGSDGSASDGGASDGGASDGGSTGGGSSDGGSSDDETPSIEPGAGAIVGNASANYLEGGGGADALFGLGGNDTVTGRAGDDVVSGGDGDDSVVGSSGNDTLYGDAGDDVIKGEADNDIAYGGAGRDVVRGHSGNDQLHGDAGDDKLEGGDGSDTLWGGAGLDTLEGGAGADLFHAGNDGIVDLVVDYAATENDRLAGGVTWQVSGGDTVVFDASGTALFRLEHYDADSSGILFA